MVPLVDRTLRAVGVAGKRSVLRQRTGEPHRQAGTSGLDEYALPLWISIRVSCLILFWQPLFHFCSFLAYEFFRCFVFDDLFQVDKSKMTPTPQLGLRRNLVNVLPNPQYSTGFTADPRSAVETTAHGSETPKCFSSRARFIFWVSQILPFPKCLPHLVFNGLHSRDRLASTRLNYCDTKSARKMLRT